MDTYVFLSDEWVAAARKIQEDNVGDGSESIASVRMNLVIGDMPFGTTPLNAHLDTSSGQIEIDTDHLDNPDVTINLNYDLAKKILVNGDGQAAIGAFFTRKLRIDGDMGKLLAFQAITPSERQEAVTDKIREMTA